MTIKTDREPNRLINEKSPYLLQHAHNPVNWYPWGEEAAELYWSLACIKYYFWR